MNQKKDIPKNTLVQMFVIAVTAFGMGWGASIAVKNVSGNVDITKTKYEKFIGLESTLEKNTKKFDDYKRSSGKGIETITEKYEGLKKSSEKEIKSLNEQVKKLSRIEADFKSLNQQYSVLKRSFIALTDKSNLIAIKSAMYGKADLSAVCNATVSVEKLCSGLESCIIRPNNGMCGDPKPYTVKYLRVSYACGKSSKSIQIKENSEATIRCP